MSDEELQYGIDPYTQRSMIIGPVDHSRRPKVIISSASNPDPNSPMIGTGGARYRFYLGPTGRAAGVELLPSRDGMQGGEIADGTFVIAASIHCEWFYFPDGGRLGLPILTDGPPGYPVEFLQAERDRLWKLWGHLVSKTPPSNPCPLTRWTPEMTR